METFIDDDNAYLRWVNQHPAGYGVNCERSLNPNYLVLHRATCYSIANERTSNYTTTGYIKVCSTRRTDLETWARREVGGQLKPCGQCRP